MKESKSEQTSGAKKIFDIISDIISNSFNIWINSENIIDKKILQTIFENEKKINQFTNQFDNDIINLDLKKKDNLLSDYMIMARMMTDFERIHDRIVESLIALSLIETKQDDNCKIIEMLNKNYQMLQLLLKSFNQEDTNLIYNLQESDKIVDFLRDKNIKENLSEIERNINTKSKNDIIELITVYSSLERIGDRILSLAYTIVFMQTGLDLRYKK